MQASRKEFDWTHDWFNCSREIEEQHSERKVALYMGDTSLANRPVAEILILDLVGSVCSMGKRSLLAVRMIRRSHLAWAKSEPLLSDY